jgi:hypothetical protein
MLSQDAALRNLHAALRLQALAGAAWRRLERLPRSASPASVAAAVGPAVSLLPAGPVTRAAAMRDLGLIEGRALLSAIRIRRALREAHAQATAAGARSA